MKKIVLYVSAFLTFLSISSFTVLAKNNNIGVYLNGNNIEFDVEPQIINGRTMVPIRAIFEAMGATVSWDESTQTAVSTKGDTVVKMTVDSNVMYINDVAYNMDVAPVIVNGRTLAPARYVGESFGATVQWGQKNKIVTLTTNNIPVYAEYYNIPDIGSFFGADLLYEFDWKTNSDIHTFVYDSKDIYMVAVKAPMYVTMLDYTMSKYGYSQIQRHADAYYKNCFLYGNLENTDYVVRIVWRVLDNDDKEVTIVEVEPAHKIFNSQGGALVVPITEVELWEKDGWYTTEPEILLYNTAGESLYVKLSEANEYLKNGWYTEPVQAMYRPNGKIIYVKQSEVELYKENGCYTEPVTLMYNKKGETQYVLQSEIERYTSDGWSIEYVAPEYDVNDNKKPRPSYSTTSVTKKTYSSILSEYKNKLKAATPGLISEYKAEAAKNKNGLTGLAEICNDKIGVLADIANDGVQEMAELLYSSESGDYDEYSKWAEKLMDAYSEQAEKIINVYTKDAK